MTRVTAMIVACLSSLWGASEAWACTCIDTPRDKVIATTPVVFNGEILRVEMDTARLQQITTFRVREAIKGVPKRMVLRIETVLKRMPQRTITIVSWPGEGACGWDFSTGPMILTVGAERDGPTLVATRCTMINLNSRRWIP